MKFGDILRNLIEEKKVSQRQLGLALNIAPSTLGNYIQGIREPDYETLKTLATYFGVTTDYLLDYHSVKNNINSQAESELIRIFRQFNDQQQELYIEQGKLYIRFNKKISRTPP